MQIVNTISVGFKEIWAHKMRSILTMLGIILGVASLVAMGAQAQTYPDKPVKVILPFPTATGPDTVMRLVGERLTKIWGQQVIIENRPGGNGWIAMDAAKRSAPDGYTLLQSDAPPMTTANPDTP